MAVTQTYKTRAIVLRKTKLGERDLIVTLIAESGELQKVVAKGARKPGSSFAAKFDLFTCVDLMAARGRNLDIVTDARFDRSMPRMTFGLEQAACASCVSELLACVCQPGLEHPRLFDMAYAAFGAMASSSPREALLLTDAALLKIISTAGFKPSFDACPICGQSHELSQQSGSLSFDVDAGGVICASCASGIEGGGVLTSASTLSWCRALLYARFSDIATYEADLGIAFDVLETIRPWIEFYAGKRMKSLDYLFSSGLF